MRTLYAFFLDVGLFFPRSSIAVSFAITGESVTPARDVNDASLDSHPETVQGTTSLVPHEARPSEWRWVITSRKQCSRQPPGCEFCHAGEYE
ncbi:hypothetical protein KIN20_033546 [Parelaphostrongylus tenuis]|uniref:Secreted protein n=1 Tax=Parelaphostrongylus tenuis TaxID=148309 RepID=A0AAD5WII4_PARTN|nr:hypothetical protein KIN20_033546 [Parelaphostrongylus tenuis]